MKHCYYLFDIQKNMEKATKAAYAISMYRDMENKLGCDSNPTYVALLAAGQIQARVKPVIFQAAANDFNRDDFALASR